MHAHTCTHIYLHNVLGRRASAVKNTSSAVSEVLPLSEWFIHSYSELSAVALVIVYTMFLCVGCKASAVKNTSSAVSEALPLSEWFIHSYSELSATPLAI